MAYKKLSYKRPVVTIVKLDPRQAILAVCQAYQGVWRGYTNRFPSYPDACIYGT